MGAGSHGLIQPRLLLTGGDWLNLHVRSCGALPRYAVSWSHSCHGCCFYGGWR